jgi:hypothetical protein
MIREIRVETERARLTGLKRSDNLKMISSVIGAKTVAKKK